MNHLTLYHSYYFAASDGLPWVFLAGIVFVAGSAIFGQKKKPTSSAPVDARQPITPFIGLRRIMDQVDGRVWPSFVATFHQPDRAQRIINEFGKLVSDRGGVLPGTSSTLLPHPKYEIIAAFVVALAHTRDSSSRSACHAGLIMVADFLEDVEPSGTPEEVIASPQAMPKNADMMSVVSKLEKLQTQTAASEKEVRVLQQLLAETERCVLNIGNQDLR